SDLALIVHADPNCKVVDDDPVSLGAALVEVLQRPRPMSLRHHLQHMTMTAYAHTTFEAYTRALARHR
ncbi:hypothetical protein RZS08_53805, partial [Arthrospira platensis SPKY1]|nr:hypothetical protein [Arthrospira platensis SPKY1]